VDAVIKVGGSLAEDPEKLRALCQKLHELSKKYAFIVVPGGGGFADVVRVFDERFTLSRDVSHRMAILAMDQFGLLLSSITPNSHVFHSLENAKKLSEEGAVPIFLPSRLMFKDDPLENSWDVTSDSIAAYVANQVHSEKLVLITDVDGVFTSDPKKKSSAKLIERLSAEQLIKFNQRTSVDRYLPKLLLEAKFDCYVVNGLFPDRVEAVLASLLTTCTFVASRPEQ
jgi:aspartokinase-like uncharacterized kinase